MSKGILAWPTSLGVLSSCGFIVDFLPPRLRPGLSFQGRLLSAPSSADGRQACPTRASSCARVSLWGIGLFSTVIPSRQPDAATRPVCDSTTNSLQAVARSLRTILSEEATIQEVRDFGLHNGVTRDISERVLCDHKLP
jgi:hypothetical protein